MALGLQFGPYFEITRREADCKGLRLWTFLGRGPMTVRRSEFELSFTFLGHQAKLGDDVLPSVK